jgi:hypothetical protein
MQLASSCSEPCDSMRSNDVCLTQVIVNFHLIVLDQLEPPSLPHVQIRLDKDVLQAFVVRVDMKHIP